VAKMGGRKQLKRYSMPSVLRLPVKSHKWITKPVPGPHPADMSIPLRIIVRDLLKVARTAKEADRIIFSGKILVDERVRKEPRFPVGFMDVVRIPEIRKTYRVSLDTLGRLNLIEIEEKESKKKLCRIVRKQMVRGGKIQLTMHDGRNVVGDLNDFKIGDTVELSLPDGKIIRRIPLSIGKLGIVTGGKNVGRMGRIEEIKKETGTVILSTDGTKIETPLDYVFVVGEDSPAVTVVKAA